MYWLFCQKLAAICISHDIDDRGIWHVVTKGPQGARSSGKIFWKSYYTWSATFKYNSKDHSFKRSHAWCWKLSTESECYTSKNTYNYSFRSAPGMSSWHCTIILLNVTLLKVTICVQLFFVLMKILEPVKCHFFFYYYVGAFSLWVVDNWQDMFFQIYLIWSNIILEEKVYAIT